MKRVFLPMALAVLGACASPRTAVQPPPRALVRAAPPRASAIAAPGREAPPGSLAAPDLPFPAVQRFALGNGMEVALTASTALPIVEIRVVMGAGMNSGAPGVAALTAELVRDGGTRIMTGARVAERFEALGATVSVEVTLDATVFSLGVARARLAEALDLLGEMMQGARLDPAEVRRARTRAGEDADANARTDGSWAAARLLFRELYPKGSVYASFEAAPSEVAKVDPAAVRELYERVYLAGNAAVILSGDVNEAAVKPLVERAFGGWRGAAPKGAEPQSPALPRVRRVLVAHRPGSTESEIYVVSLAPPRGSSATDEWAAIRIANHVLGVRALAVAPSTRSSILELAHGPQPLVLQTRTESAKTAAVVGALLEQVERVSKAPITEAEVIAARRSLNDGFAMRTDTPGALADMIAHTRAVGLAYDYWDGYRAKLRAVRAEDAAAAARLFDTKALIVVVGNADAITEPLARFGEVIVTDPEREFAQVRTASMKSVKTDDSKGAP